MALIGSVQYQVVFRHFVGHATLQQLLAAIGCALVFQMIAQMIFGADARTATSMFTRPVRGVRAVLLVAGANRGVRRLR